MRRRILALGLSVLYGFVLCVGAGYLTGGGHAAMFLAPLVLGPIGYATFFSAGLFHDPGSGLFQYVKMFDTVQFCLAVFGWTVLIELLRSHKLALRCCFVVVIILFYLVTVGTWVHMALSDSRMRVSSSSGVLVGGLLGIFVAGQAGMWWLYFRRRG